MFRACVSLFYSKFKESEKITPNDQQIQQNEFPNEDMTMNEQLRIINQEDDAAEDKEFLSTTTAPKSCEKTSKISKTKHINEEYRPIFKSKSFSNPIKAPRFKVMQKFIIFYQFFDFLLLVLLSFAFIQSIFFFLAISNTISFFLLSNSKLIQFGGLVIVCFPSIISMLLSIIFVLCIIWSHLQRFLLYRSMKISKSEIKNSLELLFLDGESTKKYSKYFSKWKLWKSEFEFEKYAEFLNYQLTYLLLNIIAFVPQFAFLFAICILIVFS